MKHLLLILLLCGSVGAQERGDSEYWEDNGLQVMVGVIWPNTGDSAYITIEDYREDSTLYNTFHLLDVIYERKYARIPDRWTIDSVLVDSLPSGHLSNPVIVGDSYKDSLNLMIEWYVDSVLYVQDGDKFYRIDYIPKLRVYLDSTQYKKLMDILE